MREIRQSGSEGGARFNPLSLPLSAYRHSEGHVVRLAEFAHQAARAVHPDAVALALVSRAMRIVHQHFFEFRSSQVGLAASEVKFGKLYLGARVGVAFRHLLPQD